MALANVTYTGDGTEVNHIITFDYLDRTHIAVFVDGVDTTDVASLYEFELTDDTHVDVTLIDGGGAVPLGSSIKIARVTPTNTTATVFADGAVVRASALNANTNQLLYIAQEVKDNDASRMGIDNDDKFDALSKIIKNVADPVNAQDAATKGYLENVWLTPSDKVQLNALNSAAVEAVNNNILHVEYVSNNMASVTAAVTNAATVNTALATFQAAFVSGATAPATPTDGDLWYDTANTQLRVYVASTYQWEIAGSYLDALTSTHVFTATAGQNSFVTDDDGNTLSIYTNGNTFVYKNGIRLTIGTSVTNDYYINGNTIILNSSANLNDVILVEVFTKFTSVQEASLDQKVTDATTQATNAASSATDAAASLAAIGSSETNAAASATSASASALSSSSDAASTAIDAISTAADTVSTAASEAAAAISETNAASSALAASTSQGAASTSASNASTSETNSAASAAAALVSENAAATSESNSATSETNAAASATASAASATSSSASSTSAASAQAAAESARDSALAAFDSFDDRYLGVFASNPTTDNDGNALIAGSLYFNSASSAMQVYTGSGWTAAYVSGTGFASLSGATFTGDITVPNITLSGTIDGRDPSTDGTKLDGIEAGATGDQTASEIMTAIQTVDGAASGLDADLLDGQEGSYYLDYSNATNTPTIPTNNNQLTNGAGYITSVPAQSFSSLTGKPTTISGYGITDAFNGAYGSLTGLPTIPTNNNQLTNGAGYVTSSGVTSVTAGSGLTGGTITSTGTIAASWDFRPNLNQYIGNNSGEYTIYDNSNSMIRFWINSSERHRMASNGDFHADGDVIAYSTSVSDERLKTDITKIDSALDKVGQLNGYTFTYKADGKKSAGVIAQEVEKILPSAVSEKELPLKIDDGVAYKTVQYDQLVGLLIEAVNELTDRVKVLEANNGNN